MKGCEVHGFCSVNDDPQVHPTIVACMQLLEGFGAPVRTNPGTGLWSWHSANDPKQTHVRCPGRRVNPSYVSSRRRVAEPAWSNIFANCSLCFWVGRLRATRCWYVHSSVSACHVASTLL